jgi:very-long-chain enoyl-CoA reductase
LSHLTLASLRKSPKDGYSIPRGFLFNYVTCANYTFEIWGWLLFSVATQSLPAALFGLCGAAQMTQWALAKHKRMKRTFDGKEGREMYPRRWVIFPPLL